MYFYLLFFHSLLRWAVVLSLGYALYISLKGWLANKAFTKADDTIRHTTATITHIQLTVGYLLYFNSPMITYFRENYHEAIKQFNLLFFGLIHILLMTLAVIVITVGSSVAKRRNTDRDKFRTMAIFFAIGLLIILIAVPWPFSPLSQRSYLRGL